MARVVLENVVKRFGPDMALDGLSLAAAPGQCLCLFGPSGCGKTTTLRIIAGLETPDSGWVLFDDHIVSGNGRFVPPQHRRVSMVFQDQALWPHFSAAKHLDFGVVLLDEPFSNLDTAWRNRLIEEFVRLKKEGKTLVLATHAREEAARLSDAVLLMRPGAYASSTDLSRGP
jgi:iron(III) transport system ATP-binding protein